MTKPTSLRIAVLSPHLLEHDALAALVAQLPGLEVVPLDADPPPNVVLWDGGRAVAAQPISSHSAILVLTDEAAGLDLSSEIGGIFSKDEGPESLAIAIRQVARGEQYLSPALIPALLAPLLETPAPARPNLAALTERESEILALLGLGLSNKAIAARLYLSVRTVEGHLVQLYRRLGVRSRSEALLIALRQDRGLGSK